TDLSGFYTVLNVPAGSYSVEASMVGYRTVTMTGVRVEVDRTVRLDFQLEPSAIDVPGIVVRSRKPEVSKEFVAARFALPREQFSHLPLDAFSDVMFLSAGAARTESTFHVRGGRATEVDYLIDGVSVVDPLSGEFGIEPARGVADEVVFMPGGFSAEYGRAMSGVVNLVTVNPRRSAGAGYRLKSEKPMPFYYDFGYTDQGLHFHLPAGRQLGAFINLGTTSMDDWDPRLFRLPHKGRADYSVYGKTQWQPSGKVRLTGSATLFRTQFDRYHTRWRFRLNEYRSDLRHGQLLTLKTSYMPSSLSCFGLALSRFSTDKTLGVREPGPVSLFSDFRFRDTNEYQRPVIDERNPWHVRWNRYWYFYTAGNYDQYRHTRSEVTNATLSGSSQVTHHHQLSWGAVADFYDVASEWWRWIRSNSPFHDTYHFRPLGLSGYVQDKIEHEGLYANLGLRYDRLDPKATSPDTADLGELVRAQSRLSPRFGASFRITEWLFARANYGYYVQFPLLSQLYDNTVNPMYYRTSYRDSLLVVGNPHLKPERTQSYEVGLQGELWRGFLLTANLWRKDVYDLVGTHEVPRLPEKYVTYVNNDYARLTGLEFIADLRQNWFSTRLSYTLSFARGTSSYANQAYYDFILRGATVPAVEYPLDFDQRNRFFLQLDATLPRPATGLRVFDAVLDSLGLHLLGYLGNGFPYSPPGGKGDPATWNTRIGPWRSNVDAVLGKGWSMGRLRLDLVVELLNILDRRDIMYVYPATGRPDDDGTYFYYYDFEFVRSDTMTCPRWFGQPGYDPQLDANHDGFVSPDEAQWMEYWRAREHHKAVVDWVNNYGPPRRARLGFSVYF
ncbi:MAG: TonB-dependent receptor, partial [candidate division WOR-3 bacterium]